MKRRDISKESSLVQSFKKPVIGISNLASVWKVKKDSDFNLRQLAKHFSDLFGVQCVGGQGRV